MEFIEAFLANYPAGRWIARERERLNDAIRRAEDEDATGRSDVSR
jgi:hypothetical protein